MGKIPYDSMARRSVVKVWVAPVESSMISSEVMTLQLRYTGMMGGKTGTGAPVRTGVDGVRTTARIWARAVAAADGTGGLNSREAAVPGEMLVTASCLSKAPESS